MPAKSKSTKKAVSFDEYKTIKDEIIEISEQRFENILTKRLQSFKKEFKSELMGELNPRFDAMEAKFDARFGAIDAKFDGLDGKFDGINAKFGAIDSRFDSVEKRLSFLTWFMPVLITLILTAFKLFP